MTPKVYFIPAGFDAIDEGVKQVETLFQEGGFSDLFKPHELIGIKIHFGEKGNDTHIPWQWVRPAVDTLKALKAKPFLTDTCVLYRSQRDNAVNHMLLAYKHGFTLRKVGAPVIIADGLIGSSEKTVRIDGELYSEVSLSSLAVEAHGLLIFSHVTGHIDTGMGGTLKNLGMGFASRKGKLKQHSNMKPTIRESACTGCGLCYKWCPADAIVMEHDIAYIQDDRCIGCGECLTVCRFNAVKHDWQVDKKDFQKRIAEHALGVALNKTGKIAYFNFLTSVTKNCDCMGGHQDPIIPDIGILAGIDPVAVDAASMDLIREKTGKDLAEMTYPEVDPWIQVHHGEKIGLGKRDYELVSLEK